MKKKELLENLIAHYEKSIELIKGETDLEKIGNILTKKNVDLGVCSCAKRKFKELIYSFDWVQKHGLQWGKYPISANTIPEAISLLQVRIEIMKHELTTE